MLVSMNDFCFIFELICPDKELENFVRAAKASKIARIDIGRNAVVKFLGELRQVDQTKLNNKMRKRLAILLEELEEAEATMPVGEKHPTMKAFEDDLQSQNFSSEDELREFIASRNASINQRRQPDLGNLTPDQLNRLFRMGWWEPGGPVKLSIDIREAEAEKVPIVNNVRRMLESILARSGPKGLKATATGNLPRSVVSDVAPVLMDPSGHDLFELKSGKKVFNETDLYCLFIQRNIAMVAKLVELVGDYWQVTPHGQNLLRPGAAAELLVTLFAVTFKSFDLAMLDRLPEDPGFQYTLPYSLWRIANLPQGAEYEAPELARKVLHPETLRNWSEPIFEGSNCTVAEAIAGSRLLRPLNWFGCLELVKKDRYAEDSYRITGLAAKIFRTPDFPKP